METPQHGNDSVHGNGSKIRGNPSKTGFLRHFRDFFKFFGNPSKFKFWGVSSFFWSISQNCIFVSPLLYSNILEGFPNIFEGIHNIFDPFPHFFDPFPLFSKTLKLICFLIFWIGFLKFLIRFRFFLILFRFFLKL